MQLFECGFNAEARIAVFKMANITRDQFEEIVMRVIAGGLIDPQKKDPRQLDLPVAPVEPEKPTRKSQLAKAATAAPAPAVVQAPVPAPAPVVAPAPATPAPVKAAEPDEDEEDFSEAPAAASNDALTEQEKSFDKFRALVMHLRDNLKFTKVDQVVAWCKKHHKDVLVLSKQDSEEVAAKRAQLSAQSLGLV